MISGIPPSNTQTRFHSHHIPHRGQPQALLRRNHRRWPWITAGVFIVLVIIGGLTSKPTPKNTADKSTTATRKAPSPTPPHKATPSPTPTHKATPAPTPVPVVQNVVYSCTGSAPDGLSITYGAEGSNSTASSLPFSETDALASSTQYYNVSAQLDGAGSVTCTTTVNWNDGLNGNETVSQTGTASGSYNIASAEVCSNYEQGWQAC